MAIWERLDSLYMIKSLAHTEYLKQQLKLYSFRMVESKTITNSLMKLYKIFDDLVNIEDCCLLLSYR